MKNREWKGRRKRESIFGGWRYPPPTFSQFSTQVSFFSFVPVGSIGTGQVDLSRDREREILCLLHGYIIYAPRSSKSRHWRVTGVTLSSFVHPPPILFSVSSTFWSSYFSIRWIDASPRDVTRYQYKKNHSRGENRAHGVRAYSNLRIESGLLVV